MPCLATQASLKGATHNGPQLDAEWKCRSCGLTVNEHPTGISTGNRTFESLSIHTLSYQPPFLYLYNIYDSLLSTPSPLSMFMILYSLLLSLSLYL